MAEILKKGHKQLKRKLYLEGGLSFANFTLLNGVFLIGFALALGANNFQLGILVAIPLFANLIQLFSAFIIESTGTKKGSTLVNLFFGRFLWIIVVLMAFGLMGEKDLLFVFMLILLLASLFTSIGNLSLLSWMKDLIPVNNLARFLGKRNMYASIGGIVAYLIGSYFVDRFPGMRVYGYIFLIAFVFGMVALLFLWKIPEKMGEINAINPKKFFKRMILPFKDKNFRPLISFGLLWAFAINLSAPFFLVFMLNDLGLSFLLVSVFLVIDTTARIYGLNLWRKMADRFGARPLLTVVVTITSFVPLGFVFVNKSNYLLIPLIFIVSAISYAGVDIALGQALFKFAPRKHDAYYLSSFTSLIGVSSALGPIVGGFLAVFIKNNGFPFIDIIIPLKYLFIFSFILRISCIPLISKIPEKKAGDVNEIIERMKTLKFASFFVNVYNVTSYGSKIVLVPQKQFFMLQRKTAERMKKDFSNIQKLLAKLSISLANVTKKNIIYYKNKIKGQGEMLRKQVDKLEGTGLMEFPQKALSDVKELQESIETESSTKIEKKAKEVKENVEKYEEKIDKVVKKEVEEEGLNKS